MVRTLTNVRHVPELGKNLISLLVLDDKGYKYSGGGGAIRMTKRALVVTKGIKKGPLYIFQGSTVTDFAATVSPSKQSKLDHTRLWHMRLAHLSEKGMSILSKQGLLEGHKVVDLKFCEHYVFSKQCQVQFCKVVHSTKAMLDYIHVDCWGPSHVPSLGGSRFFLSVIDDYSSMTWVFMMKHKSEAFKVFKQWKTLVENQTEKKIKRLRTDNDLEFCSK